MKPINRASSNTSSEPNGAPDKQPKENNTSTSSWTSAIKKRGEIPKTPSTKSRPQLGKVARSIQISPLSTFNASNESKDVLAINEEEDQDLVPKTAPRPPVNPNNSAISRFSNEDALNSCILPNLPQLPNTGEPGKNPQNKPAEDKVLHHQNEKIDADAIQENKNLAELQKTCEFKAQKIKLALEKSGIAGPRRAANILYAAAGGQDVMNDPDPETAADIEFLKKLPAQQRSMYVEALRDSFKQFNQLFQHRMPKYQDAPEALLK